MNLEHCDMWAIFRLLRISEFDIFAPQKKQIIHNHASYFHAMLCYYNMHNPVLDALGLKFENFNWAQTGNANQGITTCTSFGNCLT